MLRRERHEGIPVVGEVFEGRGEQLGVESSYGLGGLLDVGGGEKAYAGGLVHHIGIPQLPGVRIGSHKGDGLLEETSDEETQQKLLSSFRCQIDRGK